MQCKAAPPVNGPNYILKFTGTQSGRGSKQFVVAFFGGAGVSISGLFSADDDDDVDLFILFSLNISHALIY